MSAYTRREMLKLLSFVATVGSAPMAFAAGLKQDLSGKCIAIADMSSPESIRFAHRLERLGAQVLQLDTSSDRFWYDTLRSICNSDPSPLLAGLINTQQAFELEIFGRDAFYYAAGHKCPIGSEQPLRSLVLAPMRNHEIAESLASSRIMFANSA